MRTLGLEVFIDYRNVYYSLAALGVEIDHGRLPTLLAELVEEQLYHGPAGRAALADQLRAILSQRDLLSKVDAGAAGRLFEASEALLARMSSEGPPELFGSIELPCRVRPSRVFGVVAIPVNVHDDDAFTASGVERFAYALEQSYGFQIERVRVDYGGFHFKKADRERIGIPSEATFTPSEKGVDTVLALRMHARCLAADRPDAVVLVSGDADLAPALAAVAQLTPPIASFVAGFAKNSALSSVYRANNIHGYRWRFDPLILDESIRRISKESPARRVPDVGTFAMMEESADGISVLEREITDWETRLRREEHSGSAIAVAVINWLAVRARLLRSAGVERSGRTVDHATWNERVYRPIAEMAKEFAVGFVPALSRDQVGDWDKELKHWVARLESLRGVGT